MSVPMSRSCWIVLTPALIKLGEKYRLELVSLKRVECHGDSRGASSGGGVPTGAAFQRSENPLHVVPRKGMVFHGTGPSCSHGSCMGSRGTPKVDAHCWKCVWEMVGTDSDSWLAMRKGVTCCHSRKVRGCGRLLPPSAGGDSRMGSVSPGLLVLSAVL